jgi:uncharacterized protein YbaP (TraB family)
MRKLSSWLLILLLCAFTQSLSAQKKAKTQKKEVKPDNNSLLWKVSGNGLKTPSYLFGTIHVICPNDYVWTDKMKEAFNKSQSLCMELNMADPKVLLAVANGLSDTSGRTLRDYFTLPEYASVQKFFKDSLHIDIVQLQMVKPVALESMLYMKEAGCDAPTSYEESLLEKAMKDPNKTLDGLEDPLEQLDLLNKIDSKEIVVSIMSLIEHRSNDMQIYHQMVNAYKKQDLNKVYELINNTKDLEDDLSAFLDERNEKWIPRIEEKMQKKSVFFAVGTGHLLGDNGLISLLKKAGYTVEPVK